MNHKVKELFNSLYSQEEKIQSFEEIEQSRINRDNNPRGIKIGNRHEEYYNIHFAVAPIDDSIHFIDCKNSPTNCPIKWEDLEVDFSSKDKRYCEYCDKFVYKVDNEFMVQKMQDENKCIAITNNLLKKINDVKYTNLQDRLSISMLFLVYKSYRKEEFQEFIDNESNQEFILKAIILDILNSNDIKQTINYYNKNGVNLDKILFQILPSINDDKFKIQVEEKITKLIKKEGNK